MTSQILVLVFVLFTICRITCVPSFVETDSIVFPKDNATSQAELSVKLKECINDDFKIEFNGECHSLLTTGGACPERQWLVLDLNFASLPNPKIVGKCALKRCNSAKQHYWVELRRCISANESSLVCPQGNVVSTDMFGDGYCKCVEKPVHARARDGTCYPVFKQGPCRSGSVWVEMSDHTECRVDNCQVVRLQNPNKTIVPWRDNRCYAVDEKGPCNDAKIILIHPWTKVPECGESFQLLTLVDPPCQGTDHAGKCTGPVKTPDQQFGANLANQIQSKRNRKGSK